MSERPAYGQVWKTFVRNALVREMMFRSNFVITLVTRAFWFVAQLTLFEIIYRKVDTINDWSRYEFFAFMATGMLINTIVETFFMPNCANFSELIRTGNLDFALLKPIDTQFLVSLEKMDLAMLNQLLLGIGLLVYSLTSLGVTVSPLNVVFYLVFLVSGVVFFYSLMIALASTSIWMGRNQSLYDFWFYLTIFARYPRSIWGISFAGQAVQYIFTYMVPILVVVTVPARVLTEKVLEPNALSILPPLAAIASLVVSRQIFILALRSYRSASS